MTQVTQERILGSTDNNPPPDTTCRPNSELQDAGQMSELETSESDDKTYDKSQFVQMHALGSLTRKVAGLTCHIVRA